MHTNARQHSEEYAESNYSHVFMEICHLTVVLGDLIRCRGNLLPSEFWLSTLYIRKHIRPGGF